MAESAFEGPKCALITSFLWHRPGIWMMASFVFSTVGERVTSLPITECPKKRPSMSLRHIRLLAQLSQGHDFPRVHSPCFWPCLSSGS